MSYEEMIIEATKDNIEIYEMPLKSADGRNYGNKIAIRKDIPSTREKRCVLAEELSHHQLTVGDILDQSITNNRKQEYKARLLSYDKLVGLIGIIDAFEAGCRSIYSMADFLDVTCEFLFNAINAYKEKYGEYTVIDQYIIYFIPYLGVMKLI